MAFDPTAYGATPAGFRINGAIGDQLTEAAQKYGVDPDLVHSLAQQESGGNQHAHSPKGALGVMQLMPHTAEQLGVDPTDASQNIDGGVRYLKQQLDKYGNQDKALAAYNAGPAAVDHFDGVPPYKETQNYVKSINSRLATPAPQQSAPQAQPTEAFDPAKLGATPADAQPFDPTKLGATPADETFDPAKAGATPTPEPTTMDKVKKVGGAIWDGLSQPLVDNFSSTPGATKGFITKGLAKLEGENPDTFSKDHPIQDTAAGFGAGLTSPLGLALAASGVEGASSLADLDLGELLPAIGKKALKLGGLGLRGLGGEEVGRYVGGKVGMPGAGSVVGGVIGAGGLKEFLGLGEEDAEAGALAKTEAEAGASTKEAEAFQPKALPEDWKMSGAPDNTRIPQQEWFPPTPGNSDPNAAARKNFFGDAQETHPFNPPADVAGARGLNFNPLTSETPLMRSTAENPANVTYANNPEELQAAFNRQQGYINGEKMMSAIGNNSDLTKKVRDIVGMTNPANPAAPSLQKAIKNLTGENWVISSRKSLQEVANARIEGFNHLLSKGFTPQQIVDAAK